jgi:hypothetical protein
MEQLCPFAPPAAAMLRFLGKGQRFDGWKFARKADYLNTGDSRET